MTKRIVWSVIVVVALFGVGSWYVASRPSYWREKGDVEKTFDSAHSKNHVALKKDARVVTEDDGNVNPEKTAASMDKQVDISVRLDDLAEAKLAKLQHRIPSFAIPIPADSPAMQPLGYITGPGRLRVGGQIGHSTPAGLYPKGKPEAYALDKTVIEVEQPGREWVPIRAFLWQKCDKDYKYCGPKNPVADGTPICGPVGYMKGGFNERIVVNNQRTNSVYHYNSFGEGEDGYSVWVEKDPTACAAPANNGQTLLASQQH